MEDESRRRCLQCRERVLGSLRHCVQHSRAEGLPVAGCQARGCALPCVAPDTLCVHHRDPARRLTDFEREVLAAESERVMTTLFDERFPHSQFVGKSLHGKGDHADSPTESHAETASATLHAMLGVGAPPALATGERQRHIDRVVAMHEAERRRCTLALEQLLRASQQYEARQRVVEMLQGKAAAEAASAAQLPPCKARGCGEDALPGGTVYCLAHILLDTRQTLFKGCAVCQFPIFRLNASTVCIAHQPPPPVPQQQQEQQQQQQQKVGK